ncbi:MAG: protein disulfide oxidoreductase [Gammaproteobacteria bacterium]|nr:protein disulfide oxidoreductase [Gammaproteobacteria bacterium]MCW9004290.1 protein disulfide oxidoreductase [Gammaproteobacteria bacterium]MCW9055544.1 protein disulfide oxidoreductase [Gammaproteobacteria bacterium]
MITDIKDWMIKHRWLAIILQLSIIIIIITGVRAWQLRDAISGKAPDIQAVLLDGQNIKLADYSGQPVLLYFWASWCPVCKITSKSVNSIAQDYKVIALASWSGKAEVVQQYMDEAGLTMPVIVDNQGEWAERYGIKGVPASFIIDAAGDIQFIESGYTTEYGLRLRLWWLTKNTKQG